MLMKVFSKKLSLIFCLFAFSWAHGLSLAPNYEQEKLAKVIASKLRTQHLNSSSEWQSRGDQVGVLILNTLDPSRSLFTMRDLDTVELDTFAEQIEHGKLDLAFYLYNKYLERAEERLNFWINFLEKNPEEIDLDDDEELMERSTSTSWLKDKKNLKQLWRLQLEAELIRLILSDEPRNEATASLVKRFNAQRKRLLQTRSDDAFANVINSFAKAYDPHTAFLPKADSENFNINMSLSLQGIGAVLQREDEYTKVTSLIAGGPADLDGRLKPADRILGVGQGQDAIENVLGWRLDEVVNLIRGPKGSLVRLEVRSSDNLKTRIIEIIRDNVQLEDQSASSEIIENPTSPHQKIGVINIPTFYSDFTALQRGDPDYRSTTRDVKKLILDVKNNNVSGIVIDLRNNSGGSLRESYELAGLFIESGPVVQIRSSGGRISLRGDRDDEIFWTGPMAVLVDRLSASASEIFAGAIQDYGRGLIIGDDTFGKGTVQQLIPIEDGQLKVTIAKFYRISGESTQNRGIIPDIKFPSILDHNEIGENALPTALPYDQIRALKYPRYGNPSERIQALTQRHRKRVAKDPNFVALSRRIKRRINDQRDPALSLKLSTRQQEQSLKNAWSLNVENERRQASKIPLLSDFGELEEFANSNESQPDAILNETVQILIDDIKLNRHL